MRIDKLVSLDISEMYGLPSKFRKQLHEHRKSQGAIVEQFNYSDIIRTTY